MRIMHACLAAFYIDGFGYQENILPRIHATSGHDVVIVASTENYVGNTNRTYVAAGSYANSDGIMVHRLPYAGWVPGFAQNKLRAYEGLSQLLDEFRPDLIFVHDVQFWDFLKLAAYARRNGTAIVADCHTDYVNSARGFVSRRLLHGMLYRWIVSRVDDSVLKYWATLPIRSTFLQEVYGLPASKIELLPFGVDDRGLDKQTRARLREDIRAKLGIPRAATVFVTGGKLDLRKNIHTLVATFSECKRQSRLDGAHLVVFGQPDAAVERELAGIAIDRDVHLTGWVAADDISALLLAGDVAIFPGTHSVLWEQAIGLGLPTVFQHWAGMEHLDLGGNTTIIERATPEIIARQLEELADPGSPRLDTMRQRAMEFGPRHFTYSAIAAKALDLS